MAERNSSINADGIFEPFSTDEAPWEEFAHGQRFASRFKRLDKFGGGTHVGVCLEELEPGKQSGPAHYHMLEEEHLYILEGSLTLRLGDKTFELSKEDYVCFPAGQKAGHTLINHSDTTCRYLIIGEKSPHEVTLYTDSGRIQVRLVQEGYDQSKTMEYWEGEDN
ncbi:cupin domain-containing protein [Aquirhabdus sp.]|uniref:cupin domain-containing protein n=1 Tax=Aquirhabdus sp. TaxID=2824160 RepID=UPI00396C4782